MLTIISPAKTLDYTTPLPPVPATQPALLKESKELVAILKKLRKSQIAQLMDISDKLAALNVERFKAFSTPFTPDNAKPALSVFKGDVYVPMQVKDYGTKEWNFAQDHLRILSGLYGLLKPLDLMQPYRLEMGTKLATKKGADLYAFWGERLTKALNKELSEQKTPVLLNLASQEYFGAVKPKLLDGRLLTVHFKEKRGDKLQVIGLMAKKARGMMVNHIITQKIDKVEALKAFSEGGYGFQPSLSNDKEWVFVR